MQQAVTTMGGITDTLAKRDADIQTARTGLVALMAARQLTMHSFMRARRSLLAVGDQVAAGSAATPNEWGLGASTSNTPLPATDTPPTGHRVRFTKTFALEILWKSVAGHRGYVLQIGSRRLISRSARSRRLSDSSGQSTYPPLRSAFSTS